MPVQTTAWRGTLRWNCCAAAASTAWALACGTADPAAGHGADGLGGDSLDATGADIASADSAQGDIAALQIADGAAHLQLGAAQIEAQSGLGPWISFAVPPGARALAVTTEAAGAGLALAQWQDGAGSLLIVPAWLAGPFAPWLCTSGCVQRQAARPSAQTSQVVAAAGSALPAGVWRLRAYGFEPSSAKPAAAVAQLRVDAVYAADSGHGRLRVNLCLTGALGIDAKVAVLHPRIQAAITQLRDIYAAAGIDVEISLRDVKAPQLLVEHDAGDAELSELFGSGAHLPMGVNVFLVEQLYRTTASGTQAIAGLAGGIPGPPLQVGGAQSGVAVSLALGPAEDDRLGVVIAHELAHFLGLFHTVEAAAPGAEPLQDQLDDTDTGGQWLMHWSPQADSSAFSAEQARRIRASPWIEMIP